MERAFVRWLGGRLPADERLAPGVGDDAAVVRLDHPATVVTTDLLIDGVHFVAAEHPPERIGRKALAVNLSDLAAMAATPRAAFVSLALPRGVDPDVAQRLTEGMLPLATEFGCPIAGGDTNVGPGAFCVSVTAIGEPTGGGVWRRDGARAGDVLLVTGALGGSLAGKHLDFTPRVAEALRLHEAATVHAAMDLSDGLSLDLARLAEASGLGATLDADHVPVSAAAHNAAALSGRTPLDHALSDGEDFELLLAVGPDDAERLLADPPLACGLTRIGQMTAEPGVRLRAHGGVTAALPAGGYEHR